jgi:O-antigen/teichoic acid export membrane protein
VAGFVALLARSVRSNANRAYLWYAPILAGAMGLLFVRSFIYARLFSVEDFGALNQAFLVAMTFSNFAGAGLQLLGNKLLPQYYARSQSHDAVNLLACATRFFGAATLLGAGVLVIALLAGKVTDAVLWEATLLNALGQSIYMLRLIDIKSQLRFLDHARLSSLRAAAILGLGTLAAVTSHNIAATLAVEGVVSLLLAAPMYVGSGGGAILGKVFGRHSTGDWLATHLPAALSLLWLNGTLTLLLAVDRWTGIALLDKRDYGLFALGLQILVVFETLQAVVNVAAYPLMGRMIAEGQYQRAFRLATLATVIVGGLTAVLYLPFVFLLDFVLRAYLPAYISAGTVIKLAVLAGSLRLADFYASFAILCNEEQKMAWLFGALTLTVTCAILLSGHVVHMHFDPARMAMVTLAIAVLVFLLNLTIAARARRRLAPLVFV